MTNHPHPFTHAPTQPNNAQDGDGGAVHGEHVPGDVRAAQVRVDRPRHARHRLALGALHEVRVCVCAYEKKEQPQPPLPPSAQHQTPTPTSPHPYPASRATTSPTAPTRTRTSSSAPTTPSSPSSSPAAWGRSSSTSRTSFSPRTRAPASSSTCPTGCPAPLRSTWTTTSPSTLSRLVGRSACICIALSVCRAVSCVAFLCACLASLCVLRVR